MTPAVAVVCMACGVEKKAKQQQQLGTPAACSTTTNNKQTRMNFVTHISYILHRPGIQQNKKNYDVIFSTSICLL